MTENEGFLTREQDTLLDIAAWAKYLAWVVLFVFTAWAILDFIAQMNTTNAQLMYMNTATMTFVQLFKEYPLDAFRLVFGVVSIFVKGCLYFLVLKGVSLGLYMITETSINYGAKVAGSNEQ